MEFGSANRTAVKTVQDDNIGASVSCFYYHRLSLVHYRRPVQHPKQPTSDLKKRNNSFVYKFDS